MKNERGITIIETTVILSVLFILAGVMSPIVSESITTARAVKAKSDASMIAMGLINFQKDIGADALAFGGGDLITAAAGAVGLPDVLASAGGEPNVDDDADVSAELPAVTLLAKPGMSTETRDRRARSSRAQRRRWREAQTAQLDDVLVRNTNGYRYRRPGEYGGWNGPYLSADLPGDPWGNRYMVNAQFLDGGTTAADSDGRARRAVFVVSAGGNGIIETPYEQPIVDARPYGDDIVIRIQ
jgi:type II secretory pathway pseudopilin PulG